MSEATENLSANEQDNQTAGLNVDPSAMDGGMETPDAEAVQAARDPYGANFAKYGEKYLQEAIQAGWTPADGDAGAFMKSRASAPVAGELAMLRDQVHRIRQADRQSLEDEWAKIIASERSPQRIQKLIAERDKQLAEEFGSLQAQPSEPVVQESISPELISFREKWKSSMVGADGAAMRGWAEARFNELSNEYRNADEASLLKALDAEMTARFSAGEAAAAPAPAQKVRTAPMLGAGSAVQAASGGARDAREYGGSITPATMNAEQKQAFSDLRRMGVYSVSATGKEVVTPGGAVQAYASEGDALKAYLRGLNQSLAEEQQRFGSD